MFCINEGVNCWLTVDKGVRSVPTPTPHPHPPPPNPTFTHPQHTRPPDHHYPTTPPPPQHPMPDQSVHPYSYPRLKTHTFRRFWRKNTLFSRNRWFWGPIKYIFLSKMRFLFRYMYIRQSTFFSESENICIKLNIFDVMLHRLFYYV